MASNSIQSSINEMTEVYGQIESLKSIRKTLDQNGINRFNSIGDLNRFLKNYENEKEELIFSVEREYELDLEILEAKNRVLQYEYDEVKKSVQEKLHHKLESVRERCSVLSNKPAKNAVLELAYWYQLQFYLAYKFVLVKAVPFLIKRRTRRLKEQLTSVQGELENFTRNRQAIISTRSKPKFKKLARTKDVVCSLNTLIAGAIGEHLVQKELSKLKAPFVLINDFSLKFDTPIYWKKNNDLIFSVQIDHLLVTRAGVFIIETKNWSKESIKRLDLRSPVRQIRRTQHALFKILNSSTAVAHGILKNHHWGQKQLPVRNIVAMINHKPDADFKFVAIKTLHELNGYIEFFDPVFDTSEVKSIADFLIKLQSLH
jgi:hypothetical protein